MAAAELIKQLLLTYVTGSGDYQWWYFPWQLCSMPMYVCLLIGLCRSTAIYAAGLAFLSDFGLLAGICAFLDTTGFVYELGILTVYSYVWHIMLIVIGIYAWYVRATGGSGRHSFAGGVCIYIIDCIIAEIINVAAYDSGLRPINMFYISPRYLMAQVYIRDLLPVLCNAGCILLYIVVTIAGAGIIEAAGRIIIRNRAA